MKSKKINSFDLFLIISLAGELLYLIILLLSGENVAAWLAMENNFDYSFTDHFRHIAFASDMKHFYFNTQDATFPPFAYMLYYLLYKINPGTFGVQDWKIVRDYKYNMLIFIMLVVITVLLFKLIVDKILDRYSSEKRFLLVLAVVLSAPMMAGAIERGNISFLTAIMVLSALYLKDSDEPWKREAALILIAMAAGIKVYPAIVGMIYVVEKRYKETIRLVIYGLIVFLVPFAFCGGIAGLIQYLKILFFFENQGYRSFTNVRNYLLYISDLFGQYEKSAGFVKLFKLAENLYLLICVAAMFITKKKWKYSLYPAGIMALYVPYSYRYTSVYMLIPLIIYLGQDEKEHKRIYDILFALIFTIPVYGLINYFDANFYIFTPIYIMMIYSLAEDIGAFIRDKKPKERLAKNEGT
ncbi:MAG: DUF2029 domain-containing protein [Lachnospiraceae bacterium]|nr:DUF2029 domain-containing protein [Lachnospiraceae bacterium]